MLSLSIVDLRGWVYFSTDASQTVDVVEQVLQRHLTLDCVVDTRLSLLIHAPHPLLRQAAKDYMVQNHSAQLLAGLSIDLPFLHANLLSLLDSQKEVLIPSL